MLMIGVGGLLLLGPHGLLADARACCCACPPCCGCTAYRFTIAGVTGGGDCATANGTYTLPKTVGCSWTKAPGGVAAILTQVQDGSRCGKYRLTIGPLLTGASQAYYEMAVENWNCSGCNTMTLVSVIGTCSGWPPTVSVCCVP